MPSLVRLAPNAATALRRVSSPSLFSNIRKQSSMAPAKGTPYQVHISPQNTGLLGVKQTESAARKVSELLQKDLESHHVYFNDIGFHNHIPHHLLALYGTGADAGALQRGYDGNTGYQRPTMPSHDRVIEDLQNWDHAKQYLGKEQYYPDFLRFFQKEMEKKGWENVMNEYVFKGDEAADDLFARLFAGFVHPLIQLMYGMEWAQPAIVAEALAQASVHNDSLNPFLLEAEKLAEATTSPEDTPSILSLLDAVRANDKLANSVREEDENKLRDGLFARARDEMVKMAARVRVKPEQLDERTAEMYNSALYVAASAAVHPPKYPKFDFFLMHHVNSSPIFIVINDQPWITTEVKVRLLEWKIRLDLLQYAARAVPPLSLNSLTSYKPKDQSAKTPLDVISKFHSIDEDGHAIKLGRAAAVCQQLSEKHEDGGRLIIKGRDVWMKIHHLIVDSVMAPGPTWVRSAGLEDAWKEVPTAKL